MIQFIKNRKIWYSISGLFVTISLILFFAQGLKLGIDFTGGSLMEIEFHETRPDATEFREKLANLNLENFQVAPLGEKGFILRFQSVSEEKHQEILESIRKAYPAQLTEEQATEILKEEKGISINLGEQKEGQPQVDLQFVDSATPTFTENRFESIGPVIGKELQKNAFYSIIVVLIAIILYVAWAFRKVSKPVSSFEYGLVTVVTLFHDIIITVGIFVILGMTIGLEVNTPFVAALLTILGYSVNDTIVVFDRIRENLIKRSESFAEIVEMSVKQTFVRSINTSLTTLLALFGVYFFGGETLQGFVLALIIGIAFGTYSSIFIASPLLVSVLRWKTKNSR